MNTWESYVRKVVPYTPGEQPKKTNMIKLNTNENPYPPSPGVEQVIKSFDVDRLRLYPDPAVSALVNELAAYHGLRPEQVFVGVGSDDVLAMCFLTFFNSDQPILFPDITYSFYDVWADMLRIPFKTKPLDEDFNICIEDYMEDNGGIIFPNPNAPTGVELGQREIETLLKYNSNRIVIVDEAYVDFGAESALPLLDRYDNLIVVRTFSKSRSMAGSRIGYAMASEKIIKYLNDVKYSFNSYTMDQMSIAVGVASVKDDVYFKDTLEKIIATRERTKKALAALGFSFQDSKSNFIFATHRSCPAKELFEVLKKEDIYVRYFAKPRIDNFLRITIGTDDEMDRFLAFVEGYLKAAGY